MKVARRASLGRSDRSAASAGPLFFGLFGIVLVAATLALGVDSASAAPPTTTMGVVSAVSYASAHVTGTVDPADQETFYGFETSTDGVNWSGLSFQGPIAAGAGVTSVSEDLTGLNGGTEYFVRLAALNFTEFQEVFSAEPNPSFTTLPLDAPAVTLSRPSAVTATSAHLEGDVVSTGTDPAFAVNWHFECTPECPSLEGTFPAALSSHHISLDATGLVPGTAYEVRLVASNAGGQSSAGPETFTTSTLAPTLEGVAGYPQMTEASLEAEINPGGAQTTYHFDYGPTPGYGNSTVTKTLAAGGVPVTVKETILGLTPSTTYHFRLVTTNSVDTVASVDGQFTTQARSVSGPGNCPNEAIRVQQEATTLPDCRAYELVSTPPDLGDVARAPAVGDDGNHVAYTSILAADGAASAAVASTTVATRGTTGWSQIDADAKIPEHTGINGITVVVPGQFSDDFGHALLLGPFPWNPEDQNHSEDLYDLQVGTGEVSWLSHGPRLPEKEGSFPELAGAASDLSWVVFGTLAHGLLPGDPPGIYRRGSSGLELVSVLPDGSPASGVALAIIASQRGPAPWSPTLGATVAHGGAHGVSANGQDVFFNAATPTTSSALFLRSGNHTIALTESRRAADPPETFTGVFLGASPDGAVSYFSSSAPLTEGSTPEGGIYRYELASDTLTQVTAGGLISEALISDDGSHLYFTAESALVEGAQTGATNAYVLSPAGLKLIASLEPGGTIRRVSRDGRYAVIQSSMSLAGARANGHIELYQYDDSTGDLSCASCRADGGPSEGDANLDAQLPGLLLESYTQPRNLADDGRLFFASTDRLVAADSTSAADIYEFDHGTVSLLSSGRGDDDAYMIDNSDSGESVFFTTRAALTPDDKDARLLDVYDARAGGGFSFPEAGKPPCHGDECQRTGAPPPPQVPGSAKPSGAGNGAHRKRPPLISKLTSADRSRLARTGAVTLNVRLTGPGTLTVKGRGKIGGDPATLGSARRRVAARSPVTVHLAFRLSAAARHALAWRGRLKVVFETHLSGLPSTTRTTVTLTRAHR